MLKYANRYTLKKLKDDWSIYHYLEAIRSALHNSPIPQVTLAHVHNASLAYGAKRKLLTSPKKLIVDTLSGFFAGDSVQIDAEILRDWAKNNDPRTPVKAAITGEQNMQESINQVQIETFGGNAAVCKVKEISDQNLKGKNMIRIPEKVCKSLEINKGDLVKVKPAF